MSLISGLMAGLRATLRAALDAGRVVVTALQFEHASSTTDGTVFTTVGSFTPGANELQLVGIVARHATAAEAPTSVTGCGLTWVKITDIALGTVTTGRLSVWRALGASPSNGQLTFTFATAHTSAGWGWLHMNSDTSGTNGSGAIVQFKTALTGGASTTISCTLDNSIESPANATIAFVGLSINTPVTPDNEFTELGDDPESTTALEIESEWARNQQSCDPTFASANAGLVLIEVKSAA